MALVNLGHTNPWQHPQQSSTYMQWAHLLNSSCSCFSFSFLACHLLWLKLPAQHWLLLTRPAATAHPRLRVATGQIRALVASGNTWKVLKAGVIACTIVIPHTAALCVLVLLLLLCLPASSEQRDAEAQEPKFHVCLHHVSIMSMRPLVRLAAVLFSPLAKQFRSPGKTAQKISKPNRAPESQMSLLLLLFGSIFLVASLIFWLFLRFDSALRPCLLELSRKRLPCAETPNLCDTYQ